MTDTTTGAELFVDTLESYGVTHVFANPGTTELPIVDAIGERESEGGDDGSLEYVLGLHEDIAVGMAAGYASTRRYHAQDAGGVWEWNDRSSNGDDTDRVNPVGVVNLHLTPGLAHGLGNLYGAMMAGAPLVVTAGNHSTDFRHEEPALSGDPVSLAEQFTKWSAEVLDVSTLPTMLRRAFRVALTPPTGPVFLALPLDVMLAETDAEPERLGPIPTAGRGDSVQLERAANLLTAAETPAIVVGDGVARSGSEAIDAAISLAEAAGCRVHAEIHVGEVNFPATHDLWAGHVPPDAALARRAMGESGQESNERAGGSEGQRTRTDTLLFAGISSNTTLVRHEDPLIDPATTCIHVGDDPWQLGKNHPADAAVLGDPGEVLAELASLVRERIDEDERERRLEVARAGVDVSIEDATQSVGVDEMPADETRPSKVQLVEALYEAAPEASIVDEGVTSKYALLSRWPFEKRGFLSNKGGGLGYGLPAAVGAAFAEDERERSGAQEATETQAQKRARDVIGFVGDGSYLYYPQSIYTAVRHDLELTVVVPNNQNYRILKDNTRKLLGGTDDDHAFAGMDFDPPIDLVTNAKSYGTSAERIEDRGEVVPAVERALERDGPTVLDVSVYEEG